MVTLPLLKSVRVWGPMESSQYRKGHLKTMGLHCEGVVPYTGWCLIYNTTSTISPDFKEGNGSILKDMTTLPFPQGLYEECGRPRKCQMVVGPRDTEKNKGSAEAQG